MKLHDLGLHYREGTSDEWVIKEIFEERVYEIDLPVEPKIIVDIGANIGAASLWFAQKWPFAKVYAFEPQRENYELLLKNTQGYPNIFRFKFAISDFTGQADLFAAAEAHKHGYSLLTRSSPSEMVDVKQLMPWIRQHGIEQIDLLKIDCEGVEKKIIDDMRPNLAKIRAIVGEIHGAENLPLLQTLIDAGFKVFAPTDKQTFSALAPPLDCP